MNGQVPADLKYGDWLATQPKAVVEEALGKSKAKLFLGGGLKIKAFSSSLGDPLTLGQLKAKYPEVWESAGLPDVAPVSPISSKPIPPKKKPKPVVSEAKLKAKQIEITEDFAATVAQHNDLKFTQAAKDKIKKNPFLKHNEIKDILLATQPESGIAKISAGKQKLVQTYAESMKELYGKVATPAQMKSMKAVAVDGFPTTSK